MQLYTIVRNILLDYLEFGKELLMSNDIIEPIPEDMALVINLDQDFKERLHQAYKSAKEFFSRQHTGLRRVTIIVAPNPRATCIKQVIWFYYWIKKTRNGRCIKLNRPWTALGK